MMMEHLEPEILHEEQTELKSKNSSEGFDT